MAVGHGGRDLPQDWDAAYRGAPPWDIGRPQPALAAVADTWRGRVLDLGCGTAEHAMLAADLGHPAVGVDLSRRAVEQGRMKAHQRGLELELHVQDALSLPRSLGMFQTVIDSGLLHVLPVALRDRLVAVVRRTLDPGGVLHLLCFSDAVPGQQGPHRLRVEEIEALFAKGFVVEEVVAETIEATIVPDGVPALRARIRRS